MIIPISEKRREQLRQAARKWRIANRDLVLLQKKLTKESDPEKYKADVKRWNATRRELHSDALKEAHKSWRDRNKDYIYNANAAYRTRSKRAYYDKEFTSFVFSEARKLAKLREDLCGGKWHVDHIVPLKGKLVSGLHVWSNFAVIPAKLNISKRNSHCL